MNKRAERVNDEQAKVPHFSVAAAILAGGKSSRFGSDKALATVPGTIVTFLERAIETAREVADEVIVVGPKRAGLELPGIRFVPDRFPGEGPAGGMVTALASVAAHRIIVLACDQPLISPPDLAALLSAAENGPAVAFASDVGGVHPLPCLLDVAACREAAAKAFAAGTRSLMVVLERCGVVPIGVRSAASLIDIDTPDEFREVAKSVVPDSGQGPPGG